jgi:hypothetical protein
VVSECKFGEKVTDKDHGGFKEQDHGGSHGGDRNKSQERIVGQASELPISTTFISKGDRAELSASCPVWVPFSRNGAIRKFIAFLVAEKRFSLSDVKRAMHRYQLDTKGAAGCEALGMPKPSGLYVREMFRSDMFQSGPDLLPSLGPGSHALNVNNMDIQHVQACAECQSHGRVLDSCYFSQMRRCISHGWLPTIDIGSITPKYNVTGNYKTVDLYGGAVEKEFEKMKNHGVVWEAPDGMQGIISPMGAVIKNSDKSRATVLTGIEIVGQHSLSQANEKLESMGQPAIKARMTNDVSASGINRAALVPPFRYPGVADGLRIIRRNDFVGKADISRYFHGFPLAIMVWWIFLIMFKGNIWMLTRCMFGFAPCPYYCSTWSAEFRAWITADGIPCSHMMDDWLTSSGSKEETERNLCRIKQKIESTGFGFGVEKEDIGQVVVFLGILINTLTMRLSFDRTQAKAVKIQLGRCLEAFRDGRQIDSTSVRSIAGKLGWYSEVLQSGRMRVKAWWAYFRFRKKLNQRLRERLIADTEWWISVVGKWEEGSEAGMEYPILSADELLRDPESIIIVQSDCSGEDGFGYLEGYLHDTNPKFVAKAWSREGHVDSTEAWKNDPLLFTHSHDSEMKGLLDYLKETEEREKMVVWVSDALSAVWSVNKGRCQAELGWITLASILEICDEKKLLLIALWVPREQNQVADYLSHLTAYMGRDEVRGDFKGLELDGEDVEGR